MNLTRIDTIVQFTQSNAAVWNNVNVPVPAGVIVIDTVNKVVKEGNGSALFANLPVCFDYNFSEATSGAVQPVGDDVGCIAIADDQLYDVSTMKLSDILTSLATKTIKATAQQTRISELTNNNVVMSVSAGTPDGTIVICNNGKYLPGDKTLAQLVSDIIASSNEVNAQMHIGDLEWYSDAGLTQKVSMQNNLFENNMYWCKVTGFHDNTELRAVDFGLATQNANITITTSADEETCSIIAAIYGGAQHDTFYRSAVDSKGNIFVVGNTYSEGSGTSVNDALIVKLDKDLNILAKKRFGGTSIEGFDSVCVDIYDNVFAVGTTQTESVNNTNCLIVKYDNDLNIISKKLYGANYNEQFYGVVSDRLGNIIVVGYTGSEGTGAGTYTNGLIIKFDNNLNIVARKWYGGIYNDYFSAVAIDSSGNIFVVGHDTSEGIGSGTYLNALIIKFNSNLSIVARKIYGGSYDDVIQDIAIDSNDNVYCAGWTKSEGTGSPTYQEALVIKFDNSLNILARKIYGGSLTDAFFGIDIDSDDNIFCAGVTNSEGSGSNDAIVIKFDGSLNKLSSKRIGGSSGDGFNDVVVSGNRIICVGHTLSEGAGNQDGLIIQMPTTLPTGSFSGTILSGLLFGDSNLTLANSTLTLADSTLTLGDSTLTLVNSAMTGSNSNLTFEKDVIVAARYSEATKLVTSIYSSASEDKFVATAVSNLGDIYAVGYSKLDNQATGLIVKFDENLNVIARKVLSGNFYIEFTSVITDSSNNVLCVGSFKTGIGGLPEAFIIKLDQNLGILGQKSYGAAGEDVFNDIAIGNSGNLYVVGYTTSEGTGLKEGLIIKFDSSLNILYKKRYGGTNDDVLNSVAIDAVGNIICVGYTTSEGPNTSGLIIKVDTSLNALFRKIYNCNSADGTKFNSVVVVSTNIIYVAGLAYFEESSKGLVTLFDSSLNASIHKIYGDNKDLFYTEFTGINKDANGNIICVGQTNGEGAGGYDALVVKFTNNLTIESRKTYGTIGADGNIDCTVLLDNSIIISGYSVIDGDTDAMITKIPSTLNTGTYTNKKIKDLILNDSNLELKDTLSTVSNSATTMGDSALTLSDGSMTVENANGAIVKDITIMDAISNVFKVQIGDVVTSGSTEVTFNVSTDDGTNQVSKDIDVNINRFGMITALYGGASQDVFLGGTVDSQGNIICVGWTFSEGLGNNDYLIVKYDNNLNILAKKRYGGALADGFVSVCVDKFDNIYAVGNDNSQTGSVASAEIIKFDGSLNILLRKKYYWTNYVAFKSVVIDASGNVICSGDTLAEGAGGYDWIIVKFDSNLNILTRKRYGGTGDETNSCVIVDSNDNVFVIGYTTSEGAGSYDGLIIKLDPSLNLLLKKRYGGTGNDAFHDGAVDKDDNIYVVGQTNSEGAGFNGLIIKFDNNLNIVAKKYYGGAGDDVLQSVIVSSTGDIICVGHTTTDNLGGTNGDAFIVKFNKNFEVVFKKKYGGTGDDIFYHVVLDANENIFAIGTTASAGSGNNDCLVVKFSKNIPTGTFTGTTITGLTLSDLSGFALADSNLTLADSNLTFGISNLNITASTLTLANSALSAQREVINL